MVGFDKEEYHYDDGYERDVLSKVGNGSTIFDASTAWLVEMEALTQDDVSLLREIRAHRNDIAHEMAKYLVAPGQDVSVDLLLRARGIIQRLGQFWGQIDVDTNPRFDDQDVAPEDIHSGQLLLFDYVLSLVTGSEERIARTSIRRSSASMLTLSASLRGRSPVCSRCRFTASENSSAAMTPWKRSVHVLGADSPLWRAERRT